VEELIKNFFVKSREDPRIAAVHISLYVSLLQLWCETGTEATLIVFSYDVMPICKISASSTYHRVIRELDEYGYIKYTPSYNHFLGSTVCFDSL
jgi:hypothetical protein